MKKYRCTFDFVETEEEAIKKCAIINKRLSYYMRKHKPAHYTSWRTVDGKDNKFVVWYYV